eukprot:Skav217887  [mRNA]  locus=scaffold67:171805:172744:+ [translate_table: standard]
MIHVVQRHGVDLCSEGWHLTYYGNYNVSWYDPTECLPSVQDVNLSLLEECAAVLDLNLPYSAGNYLAATGDTDGVEDRNGLKAFKCWQGTPELHLALRGKWWAAPACRSNVPGSCVVSLTSGIGWGWEPKQQWDLGLGSGDDSSRQAGIPMRV